MSDPIAEAKNAAAQGKAAESNAKSGMARGKSVSGKAARFDKVVMKHLLLYLVIGLILGCTVFIPFFTFPGYSLAGYTFGVLALLCFFIGIWHHKRARKKIDWYESASFFPKFWLTIGVAFTLFLGMLILYNVISYFTELSEVPFGMSALLASTALTTLIPFLFNTSFDRLMAIEPKKYRLWVYPEHYIEKQPTWNRDRIVFANLNFKRREIENLVTTVKVKLPKEAVMGELVYLFIRDYNENRSPDHPILQLTPRDGVEGWLFSTPNKGIKAFFKKRRYVDIDKTIEENNISEEQNLYFERVLIKEP